MMHERDAVEINGWRTRGPRLLIHSCSPYYVRGGSGGAYIVPHWLREGATHTNRAVFAT